MYYRIAQNFMEFIFSGWSLNMNMHFDGNILALEHNAEWCVT